MVMARVPPTNVKRHPMSVVTERKVKSPASPPTEPLAPKLISSAAMLRNPRTEELATRMMPQAARCFASKWSSKVARGIATPRENTKKMIRRAPIWVNRPMLEMNAEETNRSIGTRNRTPMSEILNAQLARFGSFGPGSADLFVIALETSQSAKFLSLPVPRPEQCISAESPLLRSVISDLSLSYHVFQA